jgi:hypothetical protein
MATRDITTEARRIEAPRPTVTGREETGYMVSRGLAKSGSDHREGDGDQT